MNTPHWPSVIRALREALGWTQVQLADALRVRQATISAWEREAYTPRRSSQHMIERLAADHGVEHVLGPDRPAKPGRARRRPKAPAAA